MKNLTNAKHDKVITKIGFTIRWADPQIADTHFECSTPGKVKLVHAILRKLKWKLTN